jgi:hypothetical protein
MSLTDWNKNQANTHLCELQYLLSKNVQQLFTLIITFHNVGRANDLGMPLRLGGSGFVSDDISSGDGD